MRKAILLLAILASDMYAIAQHSSKMAPSDEPYFNGVKLDLDEDFFLEFFAPKLDYDRDYTGGGGLQISGRFIEQRKINIVQRMIDKCFGLDDVHNKSVNRYNEAMLGITMFTPYGRDLNKTFVIQDDRPYASLLFINTTRISAHASLRISDNERLFEDYSEKTALQTECTVGMLGLNVGREIQGAIHKVYRHANNIPDTGRPYNPVGWANQISNGGEPTMLYGVQYKRLLAQNKKQANEHNAESFISWYATVGYLTSMQAMLTVRLGVFNSKWYTFTSNTLGPTTEKKSTRPNSQHRRNHFECYAFGTLHPKVIFYNATLQGQFAPSSLTLSSNQVEHVQLQIETGIGLNIGYINLQTCYVARTPEYISPKAIPFEYVSINLSVHPAEIRRRTTLQTDNASREDNEEN